MKLLTVRLTKEQYAQIRQAQQSQLPRVSLQSWAQHALERAAQAPSKQ